MINLSIAIQHTPDREDRRRWVEAVTTQIRQEQPELPLTVVAGPQREGCWPTHRRALVAASDATRHPIAEFLDWQEEHIDQSFEWDDVRVSMWLLKTSRKSFSTVPSLAQHLGWNSSTLGLEHPSQVASWWIGADRSATQVNWSRGRNAPLEDPYQVRAKWWAYCREPFGDCREPVGDCRELFGV